ncbi:MAG: transglycosylase SLT domain-containing protein [Bdellovibrionota bacterium]|jgi:soluble lytic murein transglycosylase
MVNDTKETQNELNPQLSEETSSVNADTSDIPDFPDIHDEESNFEDTVQMPQELVDALAKSIESTPDTPSSLTPQKKEGHPLRTIILLIVLLGVGGGAVWAYQNKEDLSTYTNVAITKTTTLVKTIIDKIKAITSSEEQSEESGNEEGFSEEFPDLSLSDESTSKSDSLDTPESTPQQNVATKEGSEVDDSLALDLLEEGAITKEEMAAHTTLGSIADEVNEFENLLNDAEDTLNIPQARDNADIKNDTPSDDLKKIEEEEKALGASDQVEAPLEGGNTEDISKELVAESLEEDILKETSELEVDQREEASQELVVDFTEEDVLKETVSLDKPLNKEEQVIKDLIVTYGIEEKEALSLTKILGEMSKAFNLEQALVTAIVSAESSFNASIVSSSGKIGLLQLTPETAQMINRLSKSAVPVNDLTDPKSNLTLGLWYIKFLGEQFQGDLWKTLAAYEMGVTEFEKVQGSKRNLPTFTKRYLNNIKLIYKKLTQKGEVAAAAAFKNSLSKSVVTESIPLAGVKSDSVKTSTPKRIVSAKSLPEIIASTVVPPTMRDQMATLVEEEAKAFNLDPLFVAAVIMSESSFNSGIVAPSEKVGLLQVDPNRGEEIAKLTGKSWRGKEALLEAEYNLNFGLAYLNYSLKLYPNNLRKALLTYNLGREEAEKEMVKTSPLAERYIQNIQTYMKGWGVKNPYLE